MMGKVLFILTLIELLLEIVSGTASDGSLIFTANFCLITNQACFIPTSITTIVSSTNGREISNMYKMYYTGSNLI